jgi:hypothetical protein
MNSTGLRAILTLSLLALLGAALPAHAEQYSVEPIVDSATSSSAETQGFSQAELDQMLAPIALYPDSLLSQVLIASTYPLEIVEAARWSRQNPQLAGEDAVAAVADRDWDPSVKALVAFPELLGRLDEDLAWTRSLGDAMLYQEDQVMDAIQFLRARADAAGSLETTEYARVIREEKTIIIEPAQTRVVHVPYYDPYVVYGSWWRPAYPPVVWAPPAYYYYGHPGFYWGSGIPVSSGFFFSSFYWPQRSVIIVNTPRYYYPPRYYPARHYYTPGKRWTHNPAHRRGVTYRHPEVKKRYEQPRLKAGPVTRWPVQGGSARSDRGTDGRSRESTRPPRPGNEWRERSAAASRPDGSANRAPREGSEARLTVGPRTLRPNAAGTEQRLRGTRESAGAVSRPPQRTASSSQRSTAPTQRFSAPTERLTAPNQRATQRAPVRPPRASAPTQRAVPPPQARTPGRSSPAATAAPAPQPRASSRSSSRGSESRATPGARSDSGGANTRRGTLGGDGRRRD